MNKSFIKVPDRFPSSLPKTIGQQHYCTSESVSHLYAAKGHVLHPFLIHIVCTGMHILMATETGKTVVGWELGDSGSSLRSTTIELCDLRQVTSRLCDSLSSSVKWE